MKKILVLLLIAHSIVLSQRLSHSLQAGGVVTRSFAADDSLNILAVMVQFQTDTDDRSSGNGRFDLGVSPTPIIDAPPHDSAYFADHFLFARNYFRKASNGKQHIDATVLGTVITLSKQMKEYAPIGGNLPLASMVDEVWKKVDTLYPGLPFASYDLFVVLHAGVGKDVDLRAALGYDPTPYDLPSLYFNLNAFKNLFGASFDGIPVQNSNFRITNSVVLPETEVRKIPSVGGDFVLKLGLNGLLVASIASHLGLPDLFDTETGRTAIGRFGLMDGQSIFSFSGICPPEPSAWEKIYMGWSTPIDVYGNKTLSAPAVSTYETGSDTIYKIPISAKEYFLVENRQRDANGNGQTVTMKWNGQIVTKTFNRDEDFYSNTNIDSIYGVVLDVDELDWSLPGLINSNNNYRGGLLVWHIDETIIEKNLATNSINADPVKRGVDVEEADGSQDIGQSYDFVSPGSGSEDGSPIDYWFSGNISPVYKNAFSESTNPNSLSNSFARSHITLKNFSSSSPRMTFEANVGSANIQLLKVIKRNNLKLDNNDAPIAADLNGDGREELMYTSGDSIYVLKDDLTPFLNNGTGLFSHLGGGFSPAVMQNFFPSSTSWNVFGVKGNKLIVFTPADQNNDGIADTLKTYTFDQNITTPLNTSGQSIQFALDTVLVRAVFEAGDTDSVPTFFGTNIPGVKFIAANENIQSRRFVSRSNSVYRIDTSLAFGFNGKEILAFSGWRDNGNQIGKGIVVLNDGSAALLDFRSGSMIETTRLGLTGSIALADMDNNGAIEILVGSSSGIYGLNGNGTVVENFPFPVFDGGVPLGSSIIVHLTGSNETAILFGSTNGQLYAYTSKGKIIDGFPLQTGGIVSSPVLWGDKLVVASSDTSVYIWKTGNLFDPSSVLWGNFLADKYHSNFVSISGTPISKSSELLPKSFAYNWPNPVYNGRTNIRYFLGKTATVKIKIINMAGELVDEFNGTNYVGLDNEVQWDVSKIQSGIYFAQITASGSGGEQSQIIKIAVVK